MSTPALQRALARAPSLWRDLAIAFAGVGVFTAIRLLLWPELGAMGVFFALYFPPIMLAGVVAGTRAMLIALAASSLVAWVFKTSGHGFAIRSPGQIAAFWTFIATAGVVGAVAAYLRRTLIRLWNAEARQQQLAAALKQRAAQAQAGEARFRSIAETIPGLVFANEADGRPTYANSRFLAYVGQPWPVVQADWAQFVHPDDRDGAVAAWTETLENPRAGEIELRARRADGVYRWFLARWSPLRDAEGRVAQWVGVWMDITEQREAAELQRTLSREVSHRVKNSLSLVSALLRLQSRTLEDAARHALEEAALRVNAVARVHDMLWRGSGAGEIDLQPFLSDLCSAVAASAPAHETVCSIEPARVGADRAVPLGLLVNELLTNAYKHAYREGEEGEVRVRGVREPNRRYRLEVEDSGVGLPPGFDLSQARESLGMKVITSLAAQLEGELAAGSAEPGARFTLSIPLEPEALAGGG